MTVLAMCCFALVAWTIIVTGQHDPMQGKNVTYIFIDDTKRLFHGIFLSFDIFHLEADFVTFLVTKEGMREQRILDLINPNIHLTRKLEVLSLKN